MVLQSTNFLIATGLQIQVMPGVDLPLAVPIIMESLSDSESESRSGTGTITGNFEFNVTFKLLWQYCDQNDHDSFESGSGCLVV